MIFMHICMYVCTVTTSNHQDQIYNKCMLPVVLDGLECVSWARPSATELRIFQILILKFMVGPKLQDHITFEILQSQTKLKPILAVLLKIES